MTEFYRQYLAVAVFVVAAFGMVGAMLTIARILRERGRAERQHELLFCYRGSGQADIEGRLHDVGPESMILIGRGLQHKVTNTGNTSVPKANVVVTDNTTGVTPVFSSIWSTGVQVAPPSMER